MRSVLRAHRPVASFLALTWLLGGLWALATPVMGVPDEPAHVIRAASVVRGEIVVSSTARVSGTRQKVARVPETLAYPSPPCFAFTRSLSCLEPVRGRGDVLVEVENAAARYDPVYYTLVGLPTLVRPGEATVYVMRFLTAAMVACLLTLAVVAFRELEAPRWGLAAVATATTPTTLFLAGSVNPNAVEIAAALALWATLLVWFSHPDPALGRGRAVRAAVAAIALVATRPLGPLFLVLIVGGSLLTAPQVRDVVRARCARVPALVVGLVTVAAIGWTLAVGGHATGEVAHPELENVRRYLFDTVLSLNRFEREMIGVFGWLDTPAPEHVYIAWFAVLGFLVLAGLALGEWRHRVVLLGLMALSALVPLAVQWPAAAELGLVWQGRYHLPLMTGLPLVAGLILASDRTWNDLFGRGWAFACVVGTLGMAQVAAFWWALHRNVIGLSEKWIGFTPVWQPPLGWIPLTLAFAVAVAAWAATVARLARPGVETVSPRDSARAS